MVLYICGLMCTLIGGCCFGASLARPNSIIIGVRSFFLILGVVFYLLSYFVGKNNPNPSRSTYEIEFTFFDEEADRVLQEFIQDRKFKQIRYRKEKVYRYGSFISTARKYMTYKIEDHKVILTAWVTTGFGRNPKKEYPLDREDYEYLEKVKFIRVIDDMIDTFLSQMYNAEILEEGEDYGQYES